VSSPIELFQIQQQIDSLEALKRENKLSEEDSKKLDALKEDYNNKKNALATPSSVGIQPPDYGYRVVNELTKRQLVAGSMKTRPKTGNRTIEFAQPGDGALVEYINATLHTNPWGRIRQCDIDLKNLCALISKDVNSAIGEWNDVTEVIKEMQTE